MKITDFNVAIVENDSHLSKWIVEHRRLDVAADQIAAFAHLIPLGGTVIDIGASLGDHTATYSKLVGPHGHVVAYEPNLIAYECLVHNMRAYPNVSVVFGALGRQISWGAIEMANENLGMARVVLKGERDIPISTLDIDFPAHGPKIDFIKIDVEGMEPAVIAGGMQLLTRDRPALYVEVNRPVLAQNGYTADEILHPLTLLGYDFKVDGSLATDQCDVLCTPRP